MTGTDHQRQIQDALDELQAQRVRIREFRSNLTELSATATSPDRLLTVSVGARGEISELRFLTAGYRNMAPAELAAAVKQTISDARREMESKVAAVTEPMFPAQLGLAGAASGRFDPEGLVEQVLGDWAGSRPGAERADG